MANQAAAYFSQHGEFAFSSAARYQILRGLKEKRALRQLAQFETFCQRSLVVPVNDAIFDRASGLWADARRSGHPHEDIDLIIAATALEADRVLVTGNTSHFSWVAGLKLANWRTT